MSDFYPNGRCDVCGWGVHEGRCGNPECQEFLNAMTWDDLCHDEPPCELHNKCDGCCIVIVCDECGPCDTHDARVLDIFWESLDE